MKPQSETSNPMKKLTCLLAGTVIALALTASQSLAQSTYEPYTFSTLAGNAGYGSADGTGSAARFSFPSGVTVDSAGNIYVADSANNTIRKVTSTGVVTTLAGLAGQGGSADGMGSEARFARPSGVTVDGAGNVYVADTSNNTIRKVTPAGVVTTLAGLAESFGSTDGAGSDARFSYPSGVAVDSAGNVYVADTGNNSPIRKVTPAGVVTTLAGLAGSYGSADGTGSEARFWNPSGVTVDSAGNVYVADTYNHTIRKVTPAGVVTTLAGNASITLPNGDPLGGYADGTGSEARFRSPSSVAVDSAGNVYVADTHNYTIRKVTPTGAVTTLAGLAGNYGSVDGIPSEARFYGPSGVAVDRAGNVYVTDGDTIRKVTPEGGVTTLAGLAPRLGGSADGTGSAARFAGPDGVAVDRSGNIYVADSGNYTIRKVTPVGEATTLAGLAGIRGSDDGTGNSARFFLPTGVAVDTAGNVYVMAENAIRKVTPTGVVTTLAGLAGSGGSTDGMGSAARFGKSQLRNGPGGVAVDSVGNVYVADSRNNTIRKVTSAGEVTTLAGLSHDTNGDGFPDGEYSDGTGSAARFYGPSGVAVDSVGNVYVADTDNNAIRKVTPTGVVTTLAGRAGDYGSSEDGTGIAAHFRRPTSVAVDSTGNIYVSDSGNGTLRKGYPAPRILNSGPGFGFTGGQFGFNFTGPQGKLVVVEASSDLLSWLPIWTNTFTFPAALDFSDPQSGTSSTRFYRARLP